MNKSITLLVFTFVACSSKTPVDMEEVLYDRSGQYITADNYNTSIIGFLYNQKVYNGPGFIRYRSGEKENRGHLKRIPFRPMDRLGQGRNKNFLGNI